MSDNSAVPPSWDWKTVKRRPVWVASYIFRLLGLALAFCYIFGFGLAVIIMTPPRPEITAGIARMSFVVIAAGVGLMMREINLRLYGAIEVLFGLMVAWNLNVAGQDVRTRMAILAGAIYIMVHGFDNYRRGHLAAKAAASASPPSADPPPAAP